MLLLVWRYSRHQRHQECGQQRHQEKMWLTTNQEKMWLMAPQTVRLLLELLLLELLLLELLLLELLPLDLLLLEPWWQSPRSLLVLH